MAETPTVAAAAPAQSADAAAPEAGLDFAFTGSTKEYFGIWIINLLLTLVTLGVWSAWAKVRRIRYFYGTTSLAGDHFDYLATGWMLLKGRLIVFAVLAIYSGLQFVETNLQIAVAIGLVPLYPWVINQSLRFRAHMTVWRNVRFAWTGTYLQSVKAFLIWPLVGVVSFGLLMPAASAAARLYIARHYRFGTAQFSAQALVGAFYVAVLKSIGVFALIGLVLGGLIYTVFSQFEIDDLDAADTFEAVVSSSAVGGFLVAAILARGFYAALARNIIVNGLTLTGGHRFQSTLSGTRYAWIVLTNLVAIVVSLGLLAPWAAVRLWRYQVDCLAATPGGPLDQFVDDQRQGGTAFGQEYADIEGLDIGL